jgi:hypothetical protein
MSLGSCLCLLLVLPLVSPPDSFNKNNPITENSVINIPKFWYSVTRQNTKNEIFPALNNLLMRLHSLVTSSIVRTTGRFIRTADVQERSRSSLYVTWSDISAVLQLIAPFLCNMTLRHWVLRYRRRFEETCCFLTNSRQQTNKTHKRFP